MDSMAEKYLGGLQDDGKSLKTVITYRTVLTQFIKWFNETYDTASIEKVTPLDIKEYKQYLVAVLKRKPATVNKAIVTLKGFFEWAAENDFIKVNPTRKIKLVEKQVAAPKWLERSDQFRLLRSVEQEKNEFKQARDKAIILMMLGAGLRVEEVTNLELTDIAINSRSGSVVIRQGKRDKYREIPLNKDVRDAVKEYLNKRDRHKKKESRFLFVSERSDKITTRALQHLISEYGYRAKIDGLTCHQLRHSFCHNLILAGEGIEKVAMLAGHKSIETTRVYTIPGEKELQQAVEKISFADD